jgi:hypothetical protein
MGLSYKCKSASAASIKISQKQGRAVHLHGKVAVFLATLYDILGIRGYLLTESAPNAQPDVTGHCSLLLVSE